MLARWGRPAWWPRAAALTGLALLVFLWASPTSAQVLPELISAAARHAGVHPDLLSSIVWVESQAWPWALNVDGIGFYPLTRAAAERVLRQVGDDVDIGYAQISYRHWGRLLGLRKADLLEPWTNLVVAALILRHGLQQEAGWAGVGRYHSATPHRKLSYAYRVAETLRVIEASRGHAARGAVVHVIRGQDRPSRVTQADCDSEDLALGCETARVMTPAVAEGFTAPVGDTCFRSRPRRYISRSFEPTNSRRRSRQAR